MSKLCTAIIILCILCPLLRAPACAETNVALASEGCAAVADSVYSGDVPGKAIDGIWLGPGDFAGSNRWHAALEKPHPHWLWLKFRQPARVSRVVIHRGGIEDYPIDLVGEYSPDGGVTFRQLFAIKDNQMGPDEFSIERSFSPVTTDNVRIRILRSSYTSYTRPNFAQLSEVEVFGEYVEPKAVTTATPEAPKWSSILKPTDAPGLTVTSRAGEIEFRSNWLRVVFSRTEPRITALCWDSLGEGKVTQNLLKPGPDGGASLTSAPVFPQPPGVSGFPLHSNPTAVSGFPLHSNPETRVEVDGNVVRYSTVLPGGVQAHWETRVTAKGIQIAVSTSAAERALAHDPVSVRFAFDVSKTPVAPLANPKPGNNAPLPCILHATDFGSLLLQSSRKSASMIGQSLRPQAQWNALLSAPAAARRDDGLIIIPSGTDSFDLTATVQSIAPVPALTKTDPRLAGLGRHWLNSFQYRPDNGMLANNIVSDNCVFCMHQYADVAVYTQALPGGIEPMRMVRESLDRYLNGAPGYGVGWEDIEMDTYPSMLIAAWDVIRTTGDMTLLRKWLPHLERIRLAMEKQDRDGNGLPESTRTGVSGTARCPTSNWWDQINFGHEDAYGCALAYRALNCLADLEALAGNQDKAAAAKRQADMIKAAYVPTFLNPETGVIAGWRDSEGKLHDYYFTFVNGIAIAYGLVPDDLANKIVDRIEAKMKEVGYSRFDLGLPGPLVVIPKSDYGPGTLGSPKREDGTDSWQVFEHGGATACFASYYIQALYKLGRKAEADRILWPMMATYAKGGFQNGVGKGGEWTRWDGTPSGYEGMLTDAYTTQTVLFSGYYGIAFTPGGFRLEPWSPLKGKSTSLGLAYMGKPAASLR